MVAAGVDDKFLDKFPKLLEKLYYSEIRKQLTSPLVVQQYQTATLGRFKEIQAGYFGDLGNEDPTAPMANVDKIKDEVAEQLAVSASKVADTGKIEITVLSNEFLGIDSGGPASKKDPTPMKWIWYFMFTSFKTDLLWIDQATHEQLGGSSGTNLGRFGKGYLRAVPDSARAKVREGFARRGLNYDALLHPQSNQQGNDTIFTNITGSLETPFKDLVLLPAFRRAKARLTRVISARA